MEEPAEGEILAFHMIIAGRMGGKMGTGLEEEQEEEEQEVHGG